MNILVVEDEPLALDDLLAMLRPLGDAHTIVGCRSGSEALAQAEQRAPDMVITDIRMPGMDGIELLRRLKERDPDLAALVLSGHSEFEYARQCMRLGITDYLLKPVRTESLLRTVSSALSDLTASRVVAGQLREARLVRLLLGGRPAADEDAALLEGVWGMIVIVCENWQSALVWRDTPVSRETMAAALARAGAPACDIVGIDGHIRVLLMPLADAPPHRLESIAARLHREIVAGGVAAHTTYATRRADESPATVLAERLRHLGQRIIFAGETFLPPGPAESSPVGVREPLRLLERALGDGRIVAAVAQVHAIIAQLRQERATQADLVEALDGVFQLIERHRGPGPEEPLPDRGTLLSLLRRLRSYDELGTWVDLQLQPLVEHPRGVTTPRQLVHTLVAQVQNSYADEISLQAFAAEHGVSLAYFSRLFKDELGMTFSDYLTHIRVERAKELLVRGDLRPGEISLLVGYVDPKYFSQIFRRATGMSPLDYQRSRRQEL